MNVRAEEALIVNHIRHSRAAHPADADDDMLSAVHVVDVGTVQMTDEQYATAVRALGVLIENWRATRTPRASEIDYHGDEPSDNLGEAAYERRANVISVNRTGYVSETDIYPRVIATYLELHRPCYDSTLANHLVTSCPQMKRQC